MASEFITRVERDKDEPYTVIFRTDDADKYKHIEDECRKVIGHAKPTEQPTVDAVPVDFINQKIVELQSCAYQHFDDGRELLATCILETIRLLGGFLKEWREKEKEND